MNKIPSHYITYKASSTRSQLRRVRNPPQLLFNGSQRPRNLKKSVSWLKQTKLCRVVDFENIHCIPTFVLFNIVKSIQKSSKLVKKTTFEKTCPTLPRRNWSPALKFFFKAFSQIKTLSIVSLKINSIKYCRPLVNLKFSIPEDHKAPAYILNQIKHLPCLKRVEVCISNPNQALVTLKEAHRRIHSDHCWLDIMLLKPFWPCLDNIEAISNPYFKKVASVELDLTKLPALPTMIDHEKLESHIKFLSFLLEPVTKVQYKKPLGLIKFPGMKLELDPRECHTRSKSHSLLKQLQDLKLELSDLSIKSFLENCLSLYASSVFYCLNRLDVVEYQPEQNLAKLYFELTSSSSAAEVMDLLKDIIEFKDIRCLYLDLEVEEMTRSEFKAMIEEICRIERLQFLYVASGSFTAEVEHPYEIPLNSVIKMEKDLIKVSA